MKQAVREISYAHSAQTGSGRAMIRFLENATGRIGLIKRAQGYEDEVSSGADFWEIMAARYGLSLDVRGGSLANIPRTGPLILLANHPFGILDGLIMGLILSQTREDFRIIAHRVFHKATELNRVILPISFDETKAAQVQNLTTRRAALDYLKEGGAIGIFPGGTVATSAKLFGRPMDPVWRRFTAKLVSRSDATVVPVYFEGTNSRLFQLASHAHTTLRMGLLINEFRRRVDQPVRLVIGTALDPAQIRRHSHDSKSMMDFLRRATYQLSTEPLPNLDYGFEFEDKHKDETQRRTY